MPTNRPRHRLAVAATLAALSASIACAAGTTGAAVSTGGSTTLLTRLGADTTALEQYVRMPTSIEGTIVTRTPNTTVARYRVELGAGNAPTSATYSIRRGDGGLLANGIESIAIRFAADSAFVVGKRAAGDTIRRYVARGDLLPLAANSFGLYELAIDRLRATGRDSVQFAAVALNMAAGATTAAPIRLLGGDSVSIIRFGSPLYARHDGRGRLLWADGGRTTLKVRVDRVASADLDAVARSWTAREQAAGTLGQASTRDTARATLGSSTIWVDYGRPALRGRNVWVNGVLGDTLWRTGANAATQFRTSSDLAIGSAMVPAGTYTLFTRTTPSGYQLIINKQVGQWGTEYHPDRDLVRVPLSESSVATSIERFTIAIVPQTTSTGLLTMTWGTKQLSAPITVR